MFVRTTSLAIASATLAFATIPVSASAGQANTGVLAGGYESVSIEVRTDDINVATASGSDVLNRRIESAARQVCGDASGNIALTERTRQRTCMTKVRNEARALAAAQISKSSALAAK